MKNQTNRNLNGNRLASTRLAVRLERERALTTDPGLTVSLTALKQSLLEPLLKDAHSAELRLKLRWAAEDAAALAFLTPLPCLFFPTLLAEQVVKAHQWVERQQAIRNRNRTRTTPTDPHPFKNKEKDGMPLGEPVRSGIQQHAA